MAIAGKVLGKRIAISFNTTPHIKAGVLIRFERDLLRQHDVADRKVPFRAKAPGDSARALTSISDKEVVIEDDSPERCQLSSSVIFHPTRILEAPD